MLIIGSDLRIPKVALEWGQEARLRSVLSFRAQGETVCPIHEELDALVMPRAAMEAVRRVLPDMPVRDMRTVGEPADLGTLTATLRNYQLRAVEAMVEAGEGIAVAPCGAGKTVIGLALAHRLGRRTLILVHTKDLASQWAERARDMLGVECGLIGDGEWSEGPITIALMQSLIRRDPWTLDELGRKCGTVVVDECFPAGTLVDGRPIEAYREGDSVESYNHETDSVERRRIMRRFCSVPSDLVTVHMEDGSAITCTAGHPIATPEGYTPAASLVAGAPILRRNNVSLQAVRQDISHPPKLLRGVQGGAQEGSDDGEGVALQGVRPDGHSLRPAGAGAGERQCSLLQQGTQAEVDAPAALRTDEPDKSAIHSSDSGENGQSEPHALRRDKAASLQNAAGDRPSAQGERGERETCSTASQNAVGSATVASRGADSHLSAQGQWISNLLQGGPCLHGTQDSSGGGRSKSLLKDKAGTGQEETGVLGVARVDRVEVHQPGSDGTFGGLCPDGAVYNLEVEGNHNYFVDGVLVHNCHHIPCQTLQQLLANLPGRYRFGLSATPQRDDGLTPLLYLSVGRVVATISQEQLITDGHLMRPKVVQVMTGWNIDAMALIPAIVERKVAEAEEEGKNARSIAGIRRFFDWDGEGRLPDWLLSEVYSELASDEVRNYGIISLAHGLAISKSLVLILCNRKAHCEALALALLKKGIVATALTGDLSKKKRAAYLDSFRAGRLQVVVATQLADEGLDVPLLDRVILAAPSRSAGRTIQRLGRLMRPADGKQPVLYDLVDDFSSFQGQAKARMRAYRTALGTFDTSTIDWANRGVQCQIV